MMLFNFSKLVHADIGPGDDLWGPPQLGAKVSP